MVPRPTMGFDSSCRRLCPSLSSQTCKRSSSRSDMGLNAILRMRRISLGGLLCLLLWATTGQASEDDRWSPEFGGTLVDERPLTFAQYQGDLYMGGKFSDAGGNLEAAYVAQWDGLTWQAVGSGEVNSHVYDMTVFQGELFAAGRMLSSGGAPANGLLKWDGTWNCLG